MVFGYFIIVRGNCFSIIKSLFPLQKMNLVCFILKGKNFVLSIENQYLTYSLFCPLFYSFSLLNTISSLSLMLFLSLLFYFSLFFIFTLPSLDLYFYLSFFLVSTLIYTMNIKNTSLGFFYAPSYSRLIFFVQHLKQIMRMRH